MKKQIKTLPLLHPVPIVLLCTFHKEKRNITTIGDVAVMGLNPPLLAFSTNEKHLATDLIDSEQRLSINIPGSELVREVDYCGIYSGRDRDKTELFNIELINEIPAISECKITLLVKVISRTQVKQRVIYISEVTAAYAQDSLIVEEELNLSGFQTLLYGLDNQYYQSGEPLGRGYCEGKKINR